MNDLRNHLFETLEALKDEDKPMDLDRAKAISTVALTLIETAKVEVKFLQATGAQSENKFFEGNQLPDKKQPRLASMNR
jgi:hypothetical protein